MKTIMRRSVLFLIFATFSVTTVLGALSTANVFAASNSNEAPNPANSTPTDGHVFFLRKASNWGVNTDLKLVAYYPGDLPQAPGGRDNWWTRARLNFRPGGGVNDLWVCQTDAGDMNTTDRRQYLEVRLNVAGMDPVSYFISYDQACNVSDRGHTNRGGVDRDNVFFGAYSLPGNVPPPKNESTNKYHVNITVKYHSQVPKRKDNEGNTMRFDIRGNTDGLKIGQKGGGECTEEDSHGCRFPIIGDRREALDQTNTSIEVPFGLPCEIGGSAEQAHRVGVFDADNGSIWFPNNVTFRVYEKLDNGGKRFLSFERSSRQGGNTVSGDTTVFKPDDGEVAYSSVNVRIKPQTNYVMVIRGIHERNIIDVHVPGDTIYGDLNCGWRMKPESEPQNKTVRPGADVVFKHKATNVGNNPTPGNISITARWGKQGVRTGNNVVDSINNKTYSPDQARSLNVPFSIPLTARDGDKYCQYLRVNQHSSRDSSSIDSDDACFTVEREGDENVKLQANVSSSPDFETQEDGIFNGSVSVSNFPKVEDGGWGYNELAKPLRPTRQTAQLTTAGLYVADSKTEATPYCPTGTFAHGSACGYWVGVYGSPTTDAEGNKVCTTGWGPLADGRCLIDAYIQSVGYSYSYTYYYKYGCRETGAVTGWTQSAPSCRNYYTCPSDPGNTGWYYSAPTCNSWRCQYADAGIEYSTTEIKCDYRCEGGRGTWARLGFKGDKDGTGDLRCFVQPRFMLTCVWDNGVVGGPVEVTGNGEYCQTQTTKKAGNIGELLCATLSPVRTSGWLPSSPQPGQVYVAGRGVVTLKTWGWQSFDDENCSNVVGQPYLKVYGGDVRAGGGVGASSQSCVTDAGEGIKTRNRGGSYDYTGSGTQFAAISSKFIEGFVSGQYNTGLTGRPRGLSFANTTGTYGGNFQNSGGCVGFVDKLQNPENAPASLGNITVGSGQRKVYHRVGNIFINGDISMADSWSTVEDIPVFQLVVEGDIYISANVTQLDGMYAAVPRGGSGGNIYTCANGLGSIPVNTFTDCKRQLVVNGSLSANSIKFMRDCSSLRYATTSEPTRYFGGTNPQTCSETNRASEIINFTPEQWIRGAIGDGTKKYDAITSMPPVL